ncbi:hypothetical protein B9Z55_003204 [Caenorhabditis nigoni]|nr:hypothetical protein B9Z55_003204 [Caenorhabditis nigoni]
MMGMKDMSSNKKRPTSEGSEAPKPKKSINDKASIAHKKDQKCCGNCQRNAPENSSNKRNRSPEIQETTV